MGIISWLKRYKPFTSATTKLEKVNIGIALSGGGAKGFAHIGVLKALNEHSIDPELFYMQQAKHQMKFKSW